MSNTCCLNTTCLHENGIICCHNTLCSINLSLFFNVETSLGLNTMMPLLKAILSLIKFSQVRDVFVYDIITTIKICDEDVYHMFYDSQSSFKGDVFTNFKALINITHDNINLCRIIDLNTDIDHLAFEFVGQHIWATSTNHIGALVFVTRDIYGDVVACVKW